MMNGEVTVCELTKQCLRSGGGQAALLFIKRMRKERRGVRVLRTSTPYIDRSLLLRQRKHGRGASQQGLQPVREEKDQVRSGPSR